jgi:hypothetical protein
MMAQFALGVISLVLSVAAEDILFPQIYPNFNLQSNEYAHAQALSISTKLVTLDEWADMTTQDFSQ